MTNDTERREVARRLRECTPPANYRQSQGGGWAHLCDMALAVGFKREDNPTAWEFAQRLADLIEPSEPKVKCVAEVKVDGEQLEKLVHEAVVEYAGVDRDALLRLADELEEDACWEVQTLGDTSGAWRLKDACDRIREALGVEP